MLEYNVSNEMAVSSTDKGILPEYYSSLQDEKAKARYVEKISYVGGLDPYRIPRKDGGQIRSNSGPESRKSISACIYC